MISTETPVYRLGEFHQFRSLERRFVYLVQSAAIFELDDLAAAIIDRLSRAHELYPILAEHRGHLANHQPNPVDYPVARVAKGLVARECRLGLMDLEIFLRRQLLCAETSHVKPARADFLGRQGRLIENHAMSALL